MLSERERDNIIDYTFLTSRRPGYHSRHFKTIFLFCRTHKLFIITSGGCSNLSDKFYNCSVDIRGSNMTAEDVLESEEAYYLRRINGRNNARILKMVAEEMGLSIPTIVDTCAYDPYDVAVCTTETTINDMHRQKDGRVTVLVKCIDTTRIENGILCSMHPAEGFWLFKVAFCVCVFCIVPHKPHQILHFLDAKNVFLKHLRVA